MKKKLLLSTIPPLIGCLLISILWWWRATQAETVMVIHVPKWIAGGGNTSYMVVIGKSQIKPYGTIWRTTEGSNWISRFPLYNDKDLEKFEAREKKKDPPPKPPKPYRGDL